MSSTQHVFDIYTVVDRRWSSFQFFAIRSKAAMKIHVRFFLQTYIFTYFGQLHRSVISWSYG